MFSNRGKNPGAVKCWSQDVSGSTTESGLKIAHLK